MRTYVQDGKTITKTAPTGGWTVGTLQIIRSGTSGQCGVVMNTVAAGAETPLASEGVHELPAESGTGKSFTAGDILYRKASDGSLTKSSTGNTRAGVCWKDKAAGTAVGWVKLFEF